MGPKCRGEGKYLVTERQRETGHRQQGRHTGKRRPGEDRCGGGVMQLLAKEPPEPPEIGKVKERFSLRGFGESMALPTP